MKKFNHPSRLPEDSQKGKNKTRRKWQKKKIKKNKIKKERRRIGRILIKGKAPNTPEDPPTRTGGPPSTQLIPDQLNFLADGHWLAARSTVMVHTPYGTSETRERERETETKDTDAALTRPTVIPSLPFRSLPYVRLPVYGPYLLFTD